MLAEDSSSTDLHPATQECGVLDPEVEHILVIDDDCSQAETLAHLLTRQGYRVSTALTCREGASKSRGDAPDLILMDIGLPDGDGLQFCSDLTDDEKTADIPVIIVSGMDTPEVVRRARAAGCQFFVQKPYDPNALLVLAQRAIEESKRWKYEG